MQTGITSRRSVYKNREYITLSLVTNISIRHQETVGKMKAHLRELWEKTEVI